MHGITGRKGLGTMMSVAVSRRFIIRSVGIVRNRGKLFVTVPDGGTLSKRCHSVTRPVGSKAERQVRSAVLTECRRTLRRRPRPLIISRV